MYDLLDQALEDYRVKFGKSFDPSWNPTSERDLVAKLEASKVDFTTWRSKHEKVWNALSAIVAPVIQLGNIASSATGNVCPAASAALGGFVAIIKACESVTEAYDSLEQMLTKLQDVLSRWAIDSRHNRDDLSKQHVRDIMGVLLRIIKRAQKLSKQPKPQRWLFNVVSGKDGKTADLMSQLEALLQSEDRTRQALILDQVTSSKETSEASRVIARLQSPALETSSTEFAKHKEDRLESTGDWFRRESLYQYWMQHETPLLMLLGGRGTGKTFLATALVEDLHAENKHRRTSSQSVTSIAYFFVRPGNDLATVLKSLAYQIQRTNPDYRSHVIDTYDQQDLHTPKEIWSNLFLEYWSTNHASGPRAMLVIDGIDKLTEKDIETFAEHMIETIIEQPDCALQVAIFGELRLWADFSIGRENIIKVERDKNKADIAEYISRKLAKVRVLRKADVEEKQKYQQLILERCDGVFEWARLLLELSKRKEKDDILKLLEDPPTELDEMIELCFEQIFKDKNVEPEMLQVMLTWLTYAERSLNLGELYDKVRLATGKEYTMMWDHIIRKLSSVIRWRTPRIRQWHGVEVDEDEIEVLDPDQGWSKDVSTTVIMLSNSRIREYVIHQSELMSQTGSHSSQYPPLRNKAECDIVKSCLETIQGDRLLDKKHRFLLRYPARYLARHLQNIEMHLVDEADKTAIAKGLIYMFYNKRAIRVLSLDVEDTNGLQAFWQLWMETDNYVKTVQSWLKWALETDLGTDIETRDWLSLASTSTKELFRPWAENTRREWLTTHFPPEKFEHFDDYTSVACLTVFFVSAFDHMDDRGLLPERFRTFYNLIAHDPSADDIISLANKSELPRTSDFLLAIAIALAQQSQATAAIAHGKAAFDKDQTSWAAAWFLSSAFTSENDIESALYWTDITKKLNPVEQPRITSTRAFLLLRTGKIDEALEASKVALEADGGKTETQATYIFCLTLKRDHAVVLQFFKELGQRQQQNKKDGSLSQLADLLQAKDVNPKVIWAGIGQAYRHCQSSSDQEVLLTIIEEATRLVVANCGDEKQILWHDKYAWFYCCYVIDGLEKGIEMLEKNIARLNEGKFELDELERLGHLVSAISACAFWRWQQASLYKRSCNPNLPKAVDALRQVEASVRALNISELGFARGFVATEAALYYGQWMRVNQPERGHEWRQMFRKPVLESLAMLDDADPRNDFGGVHLLARILSMAGDFDNVRALYGAMLLRVKAKAETQKVCAQPRGHPDPTQASSARPNLEDVGDVEVKASPSEASTNSEPHLLPGSNDAQRSSSRKDASTDATDGLLSLDLGPNPELSCCTCVRTAVDLDKLLICMTCNKVFCGSCMPTEPDHYIWGRSCGTYHEFIQIWPVSEESVRAVVIERDGEIWLQEAWLEDLRARWEAVESD